MERIRMSEILQMDIFVHLRRRNLLHLANVILRQKTLKGAEWGREGMAGRVLPIFMQVDSSSHLEKLPKTFYDRGQLGAACTDDGKGRGKGKRSGREWKGGVGSPGVKSPQLTQSPPFSVAYQCLWETDVLLVSSFINTASLETWQLMRPPSGRSSWRRKRSGTMAGDSRQRAAMRSILPPTQLVAAARRGGRHCQRWLHLFIKHTFVRLYRAGGEQTNKRPQVFTRSTHNAFDGGPSTVPLCTTYFGRLSTANGGGTTFGQRLYIGHQAFPNSPTLLTVGPIGGAECRVQHRPWISSPSCHATCCARPALYRYYVGPISSIVWGAWRARAQLRGVFPSSHSPPPSPLQLLLHPATLFRAGRAVGPEPFVFLRTIAATRRHSRLRAQDQSSRSPRSNMVVRCHHNMAVSGRFDNRCGWRLLAPTHDICPRTLLMLLLPYNKASDLLNVATRALASLLGEPGWIPGGTAPVFSHVGIVADDAADRRFPRPCVRELLHAHIRFTFIGSQDLDRRDVRCKARIPDARYLGTVGQGCWTAHDSKAFRRRLHCRRTDAISAKPLRELKVPAYQAMRCVHAVRREHCTSVQSIALSGDGVFDVRGSSALIAPALLGFKRGKKLQNTIWRGEVPLEDPVYLELFSVFEAEKGGSNKVDTATTIECAIAATRKAVVTDALRPISCATWTSIFRLANARLHHHGSKLDPRSDISSTQKTVSPLKFRAGLEIKMKFISNRRNWRLEISIRDQQLFVDKCTYFHDVIYYEPIAKFVSLLISISHFGTKIDESEIQNYEISLVQHFYIGTEIKLDHGSELGSFDLGSGKMLVQPGISRQTVRSAEIWAALNIEVLSAENGLQNFSRKHPVASLGSPLCGVQRFRLFAVREQHRRLQALRTDGACARAAPHRDVWLRQFPQLGQDAGTENHHNSADVVESSFTDVEPRNSSTTHHGQHISWWSSTSSSSVGRNSGGGRRTRTSPGFAASSPTLADMTLRIPGTTLSQVGSKKSSFTGSFLRLGSSYSLCRLIVEIDAAGWHVFSRFSRFTPPLHFNAAPYLPYFALIGSQCRGCYKPPNLSQLLLTEQRPHAVLCKGGGRGGVIDYSPLTKANRTRFPTGLLPDFRTLVPDDTVGWRIFFRESPVSPHHFIPALLHTHPTHTWVKSPPPPPMFSTTHLQEVRPEKKLFPPSFPKSQSKYVMPPQKRKMRKKNKKAIQPKQQPKNENSA
ncbi:hypothetical protein PR048_008231 [Dryococelus australis]|uniref:Uncharacterized protein n=1 Tax=Dryococelus australis TaxID=614101 RepID=A0ABQ9HWH8_9NEOP|nr:hypothetical protein PR048_008231 [Dryococelus australis]